MWPLVNLSLTPLLYGLGTCTHSVILTLLGDFKGCGETPSNPVTSLSLNSRDFFPPLDVSHPHPQPQPAFCHHWDLLCHLRLKST